MPKFCKDKEAAAKVIEDLGESQLPCMIVIWTANDVQTTYLNEDDQQVLTEEQAEDVLEKITRTFDASQGMNWDRLWLACAHYYPLCCICGQLARDCEHCNPDKGTDDAGD